MPTRTPLRVPALLVLCTLFLAAGNGACSFAFVDGPPERHRQLPYFQCTTSKAWPVVDTVLGGAYAIETVAFLGAGSSSMNTGATKPLAITAGAMALLFGVSAVSGYGKASACREATEELQLRLTRMQLQAAPGFGPGQGPSPYQASPYDPWVTPRQGSASPSAPTPPPPGAGPPTPTPKSNPPPAP